MVRPEFFQALRAPENIRVFMGKQLPRCKKVRDVFYLMDREGMRPFPGKQFFQRERGCCPLFSLMGSLNVIPHRVPLKKRLGPGNTIRYLFGGKSQGHEVTPPPWQAERVRAIDLYIEIICKISVNSP